MEQLRSQPKANAELIEKRIQESEAKRVLKRRGRPSMQLKRRRVRPSVQLKRRRGRPSMQLKHKLRKKT